MKIRSPGDLLSLCLRTRVYGSPCPWQLVKKQYTETGHKRKGRRGVVILTQVDSMNQKRR